MLYFAYGSNMSSARLGVRIDFISCLGKATLPGYELFCDKGSEADGSGKFTIASQHLHQVPGVIFEISDSALDRLDSFEGPGYRRLHVRLDSAEHGPLEALTYIALDEVRDAALRPYDWYLGFAIAGAVEHHLPVTHIHRLENWPCWVDPDTERDTRNRSLLDRL